jgi:magnesium transporter
VTRSLCRSATEDISADLSLDQMRRAIDSGKGLLWVDIDDSDQTSIQVLREVFRFHPLAIEDCFNDRVDTAKIDDYGSYLFVVSQSVGYGAHTLELELTELNLFLGPNYLVTVHQEHVPSLHELFEQAQKDAHVVGRGADFLAHTILDGLVDELLPAVEDMDEELNELQRRILEKPQPPQVTDVLLFKRNTLRLRRSITAQRDIANRLSRAEFRTVIGPEADIFYRDIYDHVLRVEQMLEGLRDLADGALTSYLSATNNRMQEVMMALTIVAVIFLPLTLIASIFGTNLDYSAIGLTLDYGFYVMIAVMVVIAAGMLAFFRYRGWF